MTNMPTPTDPRDVVIAAERIYASKYQAEFETKYPDQFAVVDIESAQAVVAKYPEDAIQKARKAFSHGILHLIRIGSPSAFHMSFLAPRDAGLARVL